MRRWGGGREVGRVCLKQYVRACVRAGQWRRVVVLRTRRCAHAAALIDVDEVRDGDLGVAMHLRKVVLPGPFCPIRP